MHNSYQTCALCDLTPCYVFSNVFRSIALSQVVCYVEEKVFQEDILLSRPTLICPFAHCSQEFHSRIVLYIFFRKPGLKLLFVVPNLKVFVFGQDTGGSNTLKTTCACKPVTYLSYGGFILAAMHLDITTSQVGNRCLIAITLFFEYQYDLSGKWLIAITAAPKVNTKLKRHIEAVVFSCFSGLTSTKIVNRVSG